jgi:hypothetical protein
MPWAKRPKPLSRKYEDTTAQIPRTAERRIGSPSLSFTFK